MTLVFCGVLLCSVAIDTLLSPAGDAALRAVDARSVNVTGVVVASQSEAGKLALRDNSSSYIFADQGKARTLAGRTVHVIGVLHESTGLLEIRNVDPLPL